MNVFNKWKDDQPFAAETFVGESETVPDDTLTVSEIFARYSLGSDLSDVPHRQPVYPDGDGDVEVMEEYDKLELAEIRSNIINDVKSSVKERNKSKETEEVSPPVPPAVKDNGVAINGTETKELADESK